MSTPTVHVVGRLTSDPELRWTPSGTAVATFTVAASDRRKTPAGEWEDGDVCFLRCTVWRETAESVAESLTRGAEVVMVGRLKTRSFETRDGEKRTVVECDVEAIGPSLRWGAARPVKAERASGAQVQDPWATRPAESDAPAGRGATNSSNGHSGKGAPASGPQRGAQWPDEEPPF